MISAVFFSKSGFARHVALQPVRLNPGFQPHPVNQILADIKSLREFAATPMRRSAGGLLTRSVQYPRPQLRREPIRLLAGMIGAQSVNARRQEAFLPANNRRGRCPQALPNHRQSGASFSIRISLARNTYPAGNARDCAMLLIQLDRYGNTHYYKAHHLW